MESPNPEAIVLATEQPPTYLLPKRPPGNRFRCSLCHKVFKRPEHLKRHEKVHVIGKAHACATCGKRFARSDVLARHEYVHGPNRRVESTADKQARACLGCARARERCSRDVPCDRCSLKSLDCVYAHTSTTGALVRKAGSEQMCSDATSSSNASGSRDTHTPPNVDNPTPMPNATDAAVDEGSMRTMSDHENYMLGPMSRSHQPSVSLNSGVGDGASIDNGHLRISQAAGILDLAVPNMPFGTPSFATGNDLNMNWIPINDSWDLQSTSILDLEFLPSDSMVPPVDEAATAPTEPCRLQEHTFSVQTSQQQAGWSPGEMPNANGISPTSTARSGDSSQRGRLYATSSSARATAYERERSPPPLIPGTHAQAILTELTTSANRQRQQAHLGRGGAAVHGFVPQHTMDPESPRSIWPSTYDIILSKFHGFYLSKGSCNPSHLTPDTFPTVTQFDLFICLFYKRFLPTLPILHETLSHANEFWILTLSMATIGCQYTKTEEFDRLVLPLHEFLKQALQLEEDAWVDKDDRVYYLQALLLSHIGLCYYGPSTMKSMALSRRGSLIFHAEALGLFAAEADTNTASAHGLVDTTLPLAEKWQQWVRAETLRRLGYSIWMLDVMTFYHFGLRPLVADKLPKSDLPHDGMWTAPNEQDWATTLARTQRNPPLSSALPLLFLKKEVKPDIGEFSRVLILHGIFHEIQQVKVYFQRPLSLWVPAAQQATGQDEATDSPSGDTGSLGARWLNETETFVAWRNAALDCVDVLHWWANGVIALQSGMEHPTVLHLHFSRIVLLVPVREILLLIESISNLESGSARQTPPAEIYEAEKEVLRWAHRDESKARLATIHCGCVFWHLRRFSTSTFYEPQAIYLATLSLWAYSYYVSRATIPTQHDATHEPEDDQNSLSVADEEHGDLGHASEPEFIWVDRPNDDEMVQFFVRTGRPSSVKAFISGVGDIYHIQSPAKILQEGLRILERVAFSWGRNREYVENLQLAARVMKNVKN